MKNVTAYLEKRKNSIGTRSRFMLATGFFLLIAAVLPLNAQSAQTDAPAVLFENPLVYLYIVLVLMVGVAAYTVINARRILQRNGKTMDMPLPSFRWMASHSKFVAALFLLVVLVAIIWAVYY